MNDEFDPDLKGIEDGWRALANAIIISAVKDLRTALRGRGPAAEAMKKECIDFLLSDWAAGLTEADLKEVVRRILEEDSRKKDR